MHVFIKNVLIKKRVFKAQIRRFFLKNQRC